MLLLLAVVLLIVGIYAYRKNQGNLPAPAPKSTADEPSLPMDPPATSGKAPDSDSSSKTSTETPPAAPVVTPTTPTPPTPAAPPAAAPSPAAAAPLAVSGPPVGEAVESDKINSSAKMRDSKRKARDKKSKTRSRKKKAKRSKMPGAKTGDSLRDEEGEKKNL